MEQLLAELKSLAARHAASPGRDFGALLGNLNATIARAEENSQPVHYLYRHSLGWDNTWLDLDESQLAHVLKMSHPVERRQVTGDWEPVTEAGPASVSH